MKPIWSLPKRKGCILCSAVGMKQVTPQDLDLRLVKLTEFCSVPRSKREMMGYIGLTDSKNFRERYLVPLLNAGKIEMTIPSKPNSSNQKYKKVKIEVEN